MRGNKINMIDQKFGRGLVKKENGRDYAGAVNWDCECECGTKRNVSDTNLRSGRSKSCGCLQKEVASKLFKNRTGENHPCFGKPSWNTGLTARTDGRIQSGKDCGMFGKNISEEQKRILSKTAKERFKNPENHPSWNPKLTDAERMDSRKYPKYNEWHNAVFERDNYTCHCCHKRGGDLCAHHIESYHNNPDLRIVLKNGITLCKNCHSDFHHQYGHGNNTVKQLEEFTRKHHEKIRKDRRWQNNKVQNCS